MTLKEIMEREKVDHMLATGRVSDTQLAIADEQAKQVCIFDPLSLRVGCMGEGRAGTLTRAGHADGVDGPWPG